MKPLLEVDHLRVEFAHRHGALRALDDVSFSLAAGEILGVVGESGAGKSLTGAAIIGLLDPPGRIAAGEIRLDGRRIDNLPPDEMRKVRGRQIGMVFQDPLTSLNPLFTVGQQLVETIQAHLGLDRQAARKRAVQLLADTGIPAPEQRLEHYPHQFSGGMRQRVVIALALAAEPRLVIADEPTTALDVSIQAQIIALLKRVCRERGAAVMLITHDMGAIPSMDEDRERLLQIDGAMPRLNAMPTGCAFHPRCERVVERCRRERPELMATGGETRAACWRVSPGAATEGVA